MAHSYLSLSLSLLLLLNNVLKRCVNIWNLLLTPHSPLPHLILDSGNLVVYTNELLSSGPRPHLLPILSRLSPCRCRDNTFEKFQASLVSLWSLVTCILKEDWRSLSNLSCVSTSTALNCTWCARGVSWSHINKMASCDLFSLPCPFREMKGQKIATITRMMDESYFLDDNEQIVLQFKDSSQLRVNSFSVMSFLSN